MAMANKQAGGTLSGINVTPLTDVLLVLLITFLLSAPAFDSGQIPVPLPRTAYQDQLETEMEIVVLDHRGWEIRGDGGAGAPPDAVRYRQLRRRSAHETLALACHRGLEYGVLFRTLTEARAGGWESIVLLTEPQS